MKLLVAIDLSEPSTDTVRTAARFAGASGTIDMVFVDERGATADYLKDEELRAMVLREWDAYRVKYRAQLDMLMMKLPSALRGKVQVLRGRPAEAILRLAPDYDALVVATHGRKGVSRLMMGSVAERIVRAATVPVIVTHAASA